MSNNNLVEIVLGTFNGAKYIQQQIESLLVQTHQNWHLLIGDDFSTDETPNILLELQAQHPEKITVYLFKHGVGIAQNYSRLLELTSAEYVMFCDQDDIWLPDKIEKTLNKIKEMEEQWGNETPLLVHTDMKIVDKNLSMISHSQWKRQRFAPERSKRLSANLMQNASWGCTMMLNASLVNLGTPIPSEAFVHDFWMAILASACGQIGYLSEPTMLYRQHETNVVGSKEINFRWFINNVPTATYQNQTEIRMMKGMMRAYIFYMRYKEALTDEQKEVLKAFIELKYQPFWKEIYHRYKYGFFNYGFWSNVGLLWATFRLGKANEQYRPIL